MKTFSVRPTIVEADTFEAFVKDFNLCETDLILTNEYIYKPFMERFNLPCHTIFQEKYGGGEPSDLMVDAILEEAHKVPTNRVIAVGGGTIIDIAKVLALGGESGVDALYDNMANLERKRNLVIIPTTCGTGSEVTNIAIINRTRKGTKMGLVSEHMYADYAVLIPEFLSSLPYGVFATSSIDALIHAVESYLSPKCTPFSEMFSDVAMRTILGGYVAIAEKGADTRFELSTEFLRASNQAGIAFGNAGCAAVHAMSYALGSKYHVAHGESNYQFFVDVLRVYRKKDPDGKIAQFADLINEILGTTGDAFDNLDALLEKILHKKRMSDYGATEADLDPFAQSTVDNQQRLLGNNYVGLSVAEIREIYASRL
ncbi:4-hydroxybutyrate dehydrogenase [Intestinibacillus massiliensis]|uniref:4-hydroxybutyrate dehydrogenase n=1 Tax=Intestinibacillus massiliensis TaxID=1871029 RepID=UPI000B34C72F|nr:4-hydroxybutyrate dehydrogenase [Intestinibacillus massiliensis]